MIEQSIGKTFKIQKAWQDGNDTHIEGWLSTPAIDKERHSVEPEAFLNVMETYFSNCAPVSYQHGTKTLPAGHLQKGAVVRDGKILKTAEHPSDPRDFSYFDGTGTGVYVHGVINDATPAEAIRKGNVGCFSFIGHATGHKDTDGITHWTQLTDWMESTVSPYPINTTATFRIAKAHGYSDSPAPIEKDTDMSPEQMAEMTAMISKAVAETLAPPAQPPTTPPAPVASPPAGLSQEQLTAALEAVETRIRGHVDGILAKATLDRGTGIGTKATGGATPGDPAGGDAVDSVLKKAQSIDVEQLLRNSIDPATNQYRPYVQPEFTPEEEQAANYMTWKCLFDGMIDDNPTPTHPSHDR